MFLPPVFDLDIAFVETYKYFNLPAVFLSMLPLPYFFVVITKMDG